jgi:predicted Rossmann fold flavoprotein
METRLKTIIIIGGGAAGMLAAIAASGGGNTVLLLEKNEKLGKKLFITGKGRCNVTNTDAPVSTKQSNSYVIANPKFLYSAFSAFPNTAMMELLELAGCPLKVERGNRVFPVSDHSYDVIAALKRELQQRKVAIRYHAKVVKITTKSTVIDEAVKPEAYPAKPAKTTTEPPIVNVGFEQEAFSTLGTKQTIDLGEFKSKVTGVTLENGEHLKADCVIIACGGLSYPSTGSDGDGYRLAAALRHHVTDTYPALVPLTIQEEWCKDLQGLSLKNVELRLYSQDKPSKTIYNGFGEMLFTHFGISGPLVLSASSYYQSYNRKKKDSGNPCLSLNLKPALDPDTLDKRIQRELEQAVNKQFHNAISSLFPSKLIPVMIKLSGIPANKPTNSITREERKTFAALIQNLPMTITGTRGFDEAVITAGGISVKEVNPSTMESKRINGLYFAGEILDTDALTGGFNLQIAWSTGYLAGKSASS